MTRATDSVVNEAAASTPRAAKVVCPYCGAVNEKSSGPCPRCTMEDTPATRAATKARIGPWYVLQSRNPSAPGMKWSTLLSLVNRGQITPRSIVRGPTTHQLWRFAAHVKGLSREFGLCYSCSQGMEKTANQCPHCDRLQEPPINPDALLETRESAPRPPTTVQREIRTADDAPEPAAKADLAVREDEFPRDWKPDAGILSAKELAAAFQLDFKPSNKPEAKKPAEPAKPRSVGKILALLLFLVAVGVAALMYFKPEYRAQAMAQWDNLSGWAQTKWNSLNAPAKPNPLKDLQNNQQTDASKTAPSVQETPQPVKPFQPQDTTPVVVNPAPQDPPANTQTQVVQPATDPADQSRQWWSQALDAEAKGNYADAIVLYEKIKQLPESVWPINLQLKLQQAQDQLKK